jgi:hypothetical protein
MDPTSPDVARFAAALDTMQERETGTERVVPIAELFYHDGGPTVVDAAANPPTSPVERFRLEVVSQGEHLRGLVSDARSARDEPSRDRVRRALRQALRSLRQAAESFGERDVAEFVASHNDAVVRLDSRALDSLDEVASLLAQPSGTAESLGQRLQALRTARNTPPAAAPRAADGLSVPVRAVEAASAHARAAEAPPMPTRAATPAPAAAAIPAATAAPAPSVPAPPRPRITPAAGHRAPTPAAGSALLDDLLDRGIRTLGTLPRTPLSNPVALPEQPPVPIDVLLYRGRAALERARVIRDDARSTEGPIDPAMLAELFDLIDLALSE